MALADKYQRLDEAVIALRAKRGKLDLEEAERLVEAKKARLHELLGFASFGQYVESRLGYGARTALDRIRVAERLPGLPGLRAALESGARSWSMVRELVRVVTPETEPDWLAATERAIVRDVEQMVRGRAPGDRPTEPPRPDLDRRVVRFEVSPATYARLCEAQDQLRREVDASLSDDEVLALLLDRALGAAEPGSRSTREVSLGVCVGCARTWQRAGGEQIEVGAEVAAVARCDGRVVAVDLDRSLGSAHVGTVAAMDHEVPRPAPAVDLAWQDHLEQLHRTRETVTPKLREAVLRRDGACCAVPGCSNGTFLQIHHVEPQARGGAHAIDNLVTLCSAHHRRVHEGRLEIRGTVGVDLTFVHADGRPYGQLPGPPAAPAPTPPPPPSPRADARAALRALGLSAAESDALLCAAEPELAPAATPEDLVRAALRHRRSRATLVSEPTASGVYGARARAAARVPTWAHRGGRRSTYGELGNAPTARGPSSSMR